MFCYISFSNDEQFSSKFFEESLFCVPNYIIISLQVTSPRTMKTTSLTSNCLQSFIPKQVSQSIGQDLVAFEVHPADLTRKFQQYFKFDRPSSLIQQEKSPGHKFTLAQGLVLYYFSSARKWTNCAIVPMRPMQPSRLNEDLNRSH